MAITMPIPCQRETRSRKITIASTTVAAGYSEIKMMASTTPTEAAWPGRSPSAIPTATGTAALSTPANGATTEIGPEPSAA
jgi:hypothetical protein